MSSTHSGIAKRLLLLLVVIVLIGSGITLHNHLSLQALARHDAWMRAWCGAHPVSSSVLCFAFYTAATAASVPAAAGMTVVVGWLFGLPTGLLIISFASTAGACCSFMTSRFLFRDQVRRRFSKQLQSLEDALQRHGAAYLFLLRLVPLMPFFVINIVMGLTPMKLRTFWWVSQLGMLPGTILYVAAGANVPTLQTLADQGLRSLLSVRLLLLFALLGLMPLIVRAIFQRLTKSGTAKDAGVASD